MNASLLLKRIFDASLALFGMFLFFVPAIVFAVMIKMEDGGPFFFVQERWGKGGRRFKALKFRTMVPDAEKKYGNKPASENDVRITKTGRFLRATAMDELPQLWNIFTGDMSFVGPRALSPSDLQADFPGFAERCGVAPGLTGLAQIFASRDATIEEKFRFDREYVEKRSFFYDLKLIFMSVWITLRGKWESRSKKI